MTAVSARQIGRRHSYAQQAHDTLKSQTSLSRPPSWTLGRCKEGKRNGMREKNEEKGGKGGKSGEEKRAEDTGRRGRIGLRHFSLPTLADQKSAVIKHIKPSYTAERGLL